MQRTGLRSTGLKRSRTPIKKVGRVTRYRSSRKIKWIQDHPPDDSGFYICHLCKRPVHVSVMKLEHNLPKGSTPFAIAEADKNLKPSHLLCNNEKGSRRL